MRPLYLAPLVLAGICFSPSARALDCEKTELSYNLSEHTLDELFENGEGKPGPRRLVTEQTSDILSQGKRQFIQATPQDRDDLRLSIEKFSGSSQGGKTRFVVCKTNQDGLVSKLDEFSIEGGLATTGYKLARLYKGLKYSRLSLQLQGQDLLGEAHFRIDVQRPGGEGMVWTPDRKAPATPVSGFADLHVHQAASLAFAGGWIWGSHREGPLQERLPACHGDNHATLNNSGLNTGMGMLDPHFRQTQGAPDYSAWPRWNDIKHQQVSATWLKQAHEKGLNLMVASLVNNQWLAAAMIASGHNDPHLSPADMESVKQQLISLQQMDENTDWFTIVRDPWEARRAIARGELAVVLAVEVSDLLPPSDGPWRQQLYDLYDMGVRSIQLAHQTNSIFSGAAYHRDILKSLSRLKGIFDPHVDFDDSGDGIHNPIGLSDAGYALLDEMIRLNMLVDLAHTPLKTQQQVFQHVARDHAYYPLFNSHTRMDPLLTPAGKQVLKEFVTTDETLEYVRRTGGQLGLRTGEDPMLTYAQPHKGQSVANNCDGSVRSFIQFYQYADDRGVQLALGSDFNGFITQLAPRFGPDACANAPVTSRSQQILEQGSMPEQVSPDTTEYFQKGLAHMGLLPAMLEDMRRLGVDTRNVDHSAESFLKMWERTYDPHRGPVPMPKARQN